MFSIFLCQFPEWSLTHSKYSLDTRGMNELIYTRPSGPSTQKKHMTRCISKGQGRWNSRRNGMFPTSAPLIWAMEFTTSLAPPAMELSARTPSYSADHSRQVPCLFLEKLNLPACLRPTNHAVLSRKRGILLDCKFHEGRSFISVPTVHPVPEQAFTGVSSGYLLNE